LSGQPPRSRWLCRSGEKHLVGDLARALLRSHLLAGNRRGGESSSPIVCRIRKLRSAGAAPGAAALRRRRGGRPLPMVALPSQSRIPGDGGVSGGLGGTTVQAPPLTARISIRPATLPTDRSATLATLGHSRPTLPPQAAQLRLASAPADRS